MDNRRKGPSRKDWQQHRWVAICPILRQETEGAMGCYDHCDDCVPYCGMHPAGCVFAGGALPESEQYWLIVKGCPRFHGE